MEITPQKLNELATSKLASEIGRLVIAMVEAQAHRDLALHKLEEKSKDDKNHDV